MNKSLFAITLLSVSFISYAAEAPTKEREIIKIGNTNVIFPPFGSKPFDEASVRIWADPKDLGRMAFFCAAEPDLRRAGFLNTAMHEAAGPKLEEECIQTIQQREKRPLPISTIAMFGSHNLRPLYSHLGLISAPRAGTPDHAAHCPTPTDAENALRRCYEGMSEKTCSAGLNVAATCLLGTGAAEYTPEQSGRLCAQALNNLNKSVAVETMYILCTKSDERAAAIAAVQSFIGQQQS